MTIERQPGMLINCAVNQVALSFFVTNEADLIQRHHASGLFYETEELAIIARHFPAGGTFLDVGANVGNHAIYVAKFLRPHRVIVIEPNPTAIIVLRTNIKLNALTSIVDETHLGIGLSDRAGHGSLTVQENNLGGARLSLAPSPQATIPVIRGDALLADQRIDFIKLDVEGMELAALDGLTDTIGRCRPAIFAEIEDRNRQGFETWLERLGYQVSEGHRRYAWNENLLVTPKEGQQNSEA